MRRSERRDFVNTLDQTANPAHSRLGVFARLFEAASRTAVSRKDRDHGAAFLQAAKSLHGACAIEYAAFNIPTPGGRGLFTHCHYADRFIRHIVGERFEDPPDGAANWTAEDPAAHVFRLRTTAGEHAYLVATFDGAAPDETRIDELRTLGGYFHAHICRINGCGFERQDLSERELDCLQWTAAGKTAWEAGVILGLTERTVRFHLNVAREKLKCATTVQAVAKAVGSGIISA